MSLEAAARKLSIPELLRVLNEKLGLEYSRIRKTSLPLALSVGSLDPEIGSLETQARNILGFLHSLRNVLASVNRLPPEIISYIARSVLNDNPVDARKIVPLTHVCRYWRNSIISTPDNWTLISNEREGLAILSLERAMEAPLVFHLNIRKLTSTRNHRFLDPLLSHIKQAKFLSVSSLSTVNKLTKALPNFPKSMPNLQSLVLTNGSRSDWTQSIDLFDFSAHALKYLSLSNIPLCPSFLNIRTLTEFTLRDNYFKLHLDILLGFFEESHSLKRAALTIRFVEHSHLQSRRKTPIGNQLRDLSITCYSAMDGQALISSIALREGADLKIFYHGEKARLADLFSGVSTAHLPNLSSPTFMEYRSPSPNSIRLLGPDGAFSIEGYLILENAFKEFPLFTLDKIRELHLEYRAASIPTELHPLSYPSLEVLAISHAIGVPRVLSTLLPSPTSSPSLRTLALLNCIITEGFMDDLAQFAFDRANTTLASLRRVVIVGWNGEPPTVASVERLRKRVPVVEVMEGRKLPTDLS